MRRMIRKLGGMFVPIIFCTALIFTASMSLDLTDDLQGNARRSEERRVGKECTS